jgi:hypothetical protein
LTVTGSTGAHGSGDGSTAAMLVSTVVLRATLVEPYFLVMHDPVEVR